MSLSWSAPSDYGQSITGYEVKHATYIGGSLGIATLSTSASTSTTLTSLTPGIDYRVRVRAISSQTGSGIWAAWKTYHTHHRPEAVGTPSVFAQNSVSVTLSWPAVNSHGAAVTAYHIRIGGASHLVLGTGLTYADSGLVPNQQRTYEIRAVNAYGEGAWSAVLTATTDKTAPTLSTVPSFSAATRTTLAFTWDAATPNGWPVVEYQYQIRASGGSWSSSYSTGMTVSASGTGGLANLSPYTNYQVRVSAKSNELGWGSWRESLWRRTIDYPSAPSGLALRADYGSFSKITTIWVEWVAAARNHDYNTYLQYDIDYDGVVSRVGADRCVPVAHAHPPTRASPPPSPSPDV